MKAHGTLRRWVAQRFPCCDNHIQKRQHEPLPGHPLRK